MNLKCSGCNRYCVSYIEQLKKINILPPDLLQITAGYLPHSNHKLKILHNEVPQNHMICEECYDKFYNLINVFDSNILQCPHSKCKRHVYLT